MSLIDNIAAQLPFGKKPESLEYYFALHIGTGFVTGSIWELVNEKVDILGQKTLNYSGTEDLLEKANLALDQSIGALGIEPSKILLGVPENWLEGDDLKEAYLQFLRKMMKEYELEPMAYVANSLALTHYLQKLEGVPPTAILVGIDENVVVSVVQSGKILGSKLVAKGEELFQTVENALLSFADVESLPSKILLYSSTMSEDKLEKIKDNLVSHHWMQRLPFLHLPKIDTLKPNSTLQALVVAGASELVPELNVKHSFSSTPIAFSTPTSLGRLKTTEDELGNVTPVNQASTEMSILSADAISEVFEPLIEEDQKGVKKVKHLLKVIQHKLQRLELPAFFGSIFTHLPGLPKGRGISPKLLLPLLILVMAVVGFLFVSSAEVTVFVEPRILSRDADIVADPSVQTVDVEKKIIPGSVVQTSVSGSDKAKATGKKQIGDSAKGTVIIYNATTKSVPFSKGTVLISDDNHKFTLDESVEVASKSASAADPPTASRAVSVTASEIGPDSNLAARSDLKIGTYSKSEVVAKADSQFSGGTSKEVTVVTSEDQKSLQSTVVEALKKKAVEELQAKLTDGHKIIPDALSVTKGDYTFNKRVNDQASEFTLNATVSFKGTSYSDEDLKSIVSKLVETNVPDGFELNLADTETQAAVSKIEKDGRLIFKAEFRAKLLPKINPEELKKKIAGRGVTEAVDQLKAMENVLGAEVKLNPKIPGFSRLPFIPGRIKVTVTPK